MSRLTREIGIADPRGQTGRASLSLSRWTGAQQMQCVRHSCSLAHRTMKFMDFARCAHSWTSEQAKQSGSLQKRTRGRSKGTLPWDRNQVWHSLSLQDNVGLTDSLTWWKSMWRSSLRHAWRPLQRLNASLRRIRSGHEGGPQNGKVLCRPCAIPDIMNLSGGNFFE